MQRSKHNRRGQASATDVIYKGPVVSKLEKQQTKMIETVSFEDLTITTSGTSAISLAVPLSNPSSSTDWSTLAGVWDEFRVIASSAQFTPITSSAPSTTMGCVVQAAVDRDSSAAPTSYAALANYESCIYFPVDKVKTLTWRMTGTNEANWINVNSPVTTGTFKFFGQCPALVSTIVGHLRVAYRIQFRGRGN